LIIIIRTIITIIRTIIAAPIINKRVLFFSKNPISSSSSSGIQGTNLISFGPKVLKSA
jgi:hypothetical protein